PIPICIAVVLAIIVVLMWLRARGNFIFTDCIVRNRGAIAEPWRQYRKEGNSYFLFLLAVALGSMVLVGLIALIIFVPLGLFGQGMHSDAMTPVFIVFLIFLILFWIYFAFFFCV